MGDILVVDDDPDVRDLLRDLLELEDYEVREAADGPSALAAVQERVPDCMVLDVMMPGMSGLDVLRSIRAGSATKNLPVILLTAAGDDETTWAGWTSGASLFLPKPFDPGHLTDWIDRLLASPDAARGGGLGDEPESAY